MGYKVEITETLSRVIDSDGLDPDEAIKDVMRQYKNGDIVLDSLDFVGVEIKIISNE